MGEVKSCYERYACRFINGQFIPAVECVSKPDVSCALICLETKPVKIAFSSEEV